MSRLFDAYVAGLLAGFLLESILYGIFLVSCGFAAKALLTIGYPPRLRRQRAEREGIGLSLWIILFVSTGINISCVIVQEWNALRFSILPVNTSAVPVIDKIEIYSIVVQILIANFVSVSRFFCFIIVLNLTHIIDRTYMDYLRQKNKGNHCSYGVIHGRWYRGHKICGVVLGPRQL
jgi:hypothetical protein